MVVLSRVEQKVRLLGEVPVPFENGNMLRLILSRT